MTRAPPRLRLFERIGRGAFGAVYRGSYLLPDGRWVPAAVKVPGKGRIDGEGNDASLLDEARLLNRLDHPNIVRYYGIEPVLDHDGQVTRGLVMELVRGPDLRRIGRALRKRGGFFPLTTVVYVLQRLCAALGHAHALRDQIGSSVGLVHRDLKPSNVLVDGQGELKLFDFNIAWARRRLVDTTRVGVTKGTVPYMPPEQVRGSPLDGRADLFNLGVLAFELAAGVRYFPVSAADKDGPIRERLRIIYETDFEDRVELLTAQLLAADRHGLPVEEARDFEALLAWLLARDREDRPNDAADFLATLDAFSDIWPPDRGKMQLAQIVAPLLPDWVGSVEAGLE